MATKEQVDALLRLGLDYSGAAGELGIPPGQAYLTATGMPADGAGTLTRAAGRDSYGSRAQALVNPREVSPTSRGDVLDWMRRRAFADAAFRQPTSSQPPSSQPRSSQPPSNQSPSSQTADPPGGESPARQSRAGNAGRRNAGRNGSGNGSGRNGSGRNGTGRNGSGRGGTGGASGRRPNGKDGS